MKKDKKNYKLEFTGNWFIDTGILGFVNLMGEVYGWNLEELNKKIEEDEEKVYYGYFPFGYVYYNNLICKEKKKENHNIYIEKIEKEIKELKENIFEKTWDIIKKSYFNNGRIDLRSKNSFYFFQNFLFFQPNVKEDKQKENFKEILGLTEPKKEALINIDKTINKILPSKKEFSNISYTDNFFNNIFNNYIFFINFPFAFQEINKENLFFYSNNLSVSYLLTQKIKKMKIKSISIDKDSFFKIPWNILIDLIIEKKTEWALENLYIIKYKTGENQKIEVEYIPFPKLQSSLIIDEKIRENLNKNILIYSKNSKIKDKYVWIIEEFIKGKPLYPLILNHINLVLGEETNLVFNASFYSLIIEAKIKKIREIEKNIFSQNFFDNYKDLLDKIKEEIILCSINANFINQISNDSKTKKRIAIELYNSIKEKNKNLFLNILLKNLNENLKLCRNKNIKEFIFKKIINNEKTFEYYSLILVLYLIKGEKK
ncbi:MAG: hypothetical protein QXE31_03470 [Candidatus Woesearchaeota archaeon]